MAEAIGTAWLVFGGCGSALLATSLPQLGIGFAGVSLAFGLSLFTMIVTLGPISGGHFNPAVSLGLWAGGYFPIRLVIPYIFAQVLGGVLAAGLLYVIISIDHTVNLSNGFASNGYGQLSLGGFGLYPVLITETLMTCIFTLVIIGSFENKKLVDIAPLTIGLCLTVIHLVSIPIDNTSVNPARSTAMALFAGGQYISQLWVFWLSPLLGGVIGGAISRFLFRKNISYTH